MMYMYVRNTLINYLLMYFAWIMLYIIIASSFNALQGHRKCEGSQFFDFFWQCMLILYITCNYLLSQDKVSSIHRCKWHSNSHILYNSFSRAPEDLDKTSMNVLDHQMKELENYRSAVHKMGQDILALRQQVRELEANNSQLRRDLANYNDASKLMIESSELDGLTKPEIMSRYGK